MPSPSSLSVPDALRHDGTPTGCLCAMDEALAYADSAEMTFLRPGDMPSLFAVECRTIESNPDRANRLLGRLRAKAGDAAVGIVLHALVAMPADIEASLLHVVRGVLRRGPGWLQARADPHVAAVRTCARRVGTEIHRLKGLLRFAQLASGRWLATCEPDYDVLMPVAFHFRRRLADAHWLILDARHQTAVSWNGCRLNAETRGTRPLLDNEIKAWLGDDVISADEVRARRLWQTFHQSVSIETRANPRLQRRSMPLRYWKHLTEMESEIQP